MFDRYTEKARRVIFFARYEASQYGSRSIETEHLLLGLLREDPALIRQFLGPSSVAASIHSEIERKTTRGERFPTSIEVPLTEESEKVLNFAVQEAERLGQRHVGTEHLLLGMLSVEGSLAARLLRERGLKSEAIREQVAKGLAASLKAQLVPSRSAIVRLDSFLAGLKRYDWERLAPFFAEKTHLVDWTGKRWIGREVIEKQFEAIFAPYAKKNVTFLLEGVYAGAAGTVMASILWENLTFRGEAMRCMHRMTVVLAQEGDDWAISLLQVTPVISI